jgi:uncharacterized delta-60 repeat protein
VGEAGEGVTLEVVRGKRLQESATVDFFTTSVTAVAGEDYTAVSGTLTFAPGDTKRTLTVPILNDGRQEGAESFRVVLANPSAGMGLDDGSIVDVTIADNDKPLVLDAPPLTEKSGSTNLVVRWQNDCGHPCSLTYAAMGGTATPGEDYVLASGTLVLAPGAVTAPIPITVLDDALAEGDETIEVTCVVSDAGITNTYTLVLADDEKVVLVDGRFQADALGRFEIHKMIQDAEGRLVLEGYDPAVGAETVRRLDADGTVDASFRCGISNGAPILAVALDPEGRVLCGLDVSPGLVRLQANGELDPAFVTGWPADGGRVLQIAVQPDGRILVARWVDSGITILRLLSTGAPDLAFTVVSVYGEESPWLSSLLILPGRGILLAGGFDTVGGVFRTGVALLKENGGVDPGFSPRLGTAGSERVGVQAVGLCPGGDLLVAGNFSSVSGVERVGLARLQSDGSLDASFNAHFKEAGRVQAIAVQPDGRALVAGEWLPVQDEWGADLVRLSVNGERDPSLARVETDGYLQALAFGADNTVYVAGWFQVLNGTRCSSVARLFLDGANRAGAQFALGDIAVSENASTAILTVERLGSATGTLTIEWTTAGGRATPDVDYRVASGAVTFGPLENTKTIAIEILDDGSVEGEENLRVSLKSPAAGIVLGLPSVAQVRIVDNEVPAVLDRSFRPAPALVRESAFLLLPDGRILVAGELLDANDHRGWGIIRLQPDGSLDTAYTADYTDGTIACLAATAGGKVLAGGWFSTVNGQPRQGVVRLDPNGNVDAQFAAAPGISGVSRLAVDSQGRILLIADGQVRRLLANGAWDGTFQSVSDLLSGPQCLVPLTDGKCLVAGDSGIVRLNENGSTDSGFHRVQLENGAWGWTSVQAILPLVDGRTIIGGVFTKVDGSDYSGLARLDADGTLDQSFVSGAGFRWDYADGWPNPGTVTALTEAADGRLLVAGLFNSVHGVPQGQLVWLEADGALADPIGPVLLLCPG